MSDILDIQQVISTLLKRLEEQGKELELLRKENTTLRERLLHYEHPQDSHNSHQPPSKDLPVNKAIRKTQSLRKPSGLSPGGQAGHRGVTPERQRPDETVFLSPGYCSHCGMDLSSVAGEVTGCRQVIDIPVIHPVVKEYRIVRKVCGCSHVNEGAFGYPGSSAAVYGENIRALAGYLSCCRHIPYKRLKVLLGEVYGLNLSEGTLYNILQRLHERSGAAYGEIRSRLMPK
jgi:transposase